MMSKCSGKAYILLFIAAMMFAVVGVAVPGFIQVAQADQGEQSLSAAAVVRMPDVTEQMANASYWIGKQQDTGAVLADRAAIGALNQAGIDASGTALQPLKTAVERFYTQEEQQRLKGSIEGELADFVARGAQDVNGNALTADEAATIAANCPTDGSIPSTASGSTIASGYAIVTTHTTMRCFPTDRMIGLTPGDKDDDNLYLTALRVNEPVLIRAQSVDKRFYLCISSCMQASWVPAEDIAICKDGAEWLAAWDIPAGQELVVTDYKIRTEQSRETPNTANRMLYMGTTLERVDLSTPEQALEIVGTRSAYNNYVCYLPVRNSDGTYAKELALIAESADVSEGFLPLTKENIIKQAFKALGQKYGWGGMLEADDCSGYVRDVYKCFGLELARNTTWQMNLPVQKYDLSALDDAHKTAALAQMPLGTVLFWSGHEMFYLGQENGKTYVISATGSVGDIYGESNNVNQIKTVIINTLDTVRGNRTKWLSNITCANVPYIPASENAPSVYDVAFYEKSAVWPGNSYEYTGKAITPNAEIPGLVKDTDYEVVYENNTEPGTATITIKGIGNYSGSLSKTFEITEQKQDDQIAYLATASETSWTPGSSLGLIFTFERNKDNASTFDHFIGVRVDGVELSEDCYTARSGSVIVELLPAYLETLDEGSHTLQPMFDDGEGDAVTFTVSAAPKEEMSEAAGSTQAGSSSSSNTSKNASVTAKSTSSTAMPKTGDVTPIAAICLACLVSLAVVFVVRRKLG